MARSGSLDDTNDKNQRGAAPNQAGGDPARAFVDSVPPFLASVKTPVNQRVSSMPVTMEQSDCVCERNLAQYAYWKQIALTENTGLDPSAVYRLWASKYPRNTPTGRPDQNMQLAICCRVRVLSPTQTVVVSADTGASSILGVIEDAPAPRSEFSLEMELPPL